LFKLTNLRDLTVSHRRAILDLLSARGHSAMGIGSYNIPKRISFVFGAGAFFKFFILKPERQLHPTRGVTVGRGWESVGLTTTGVPVANMAIQTAVPRCPRNVTVDRPKKRLPALASSTGTWWPPGIRRAPDDCRGKTESTIGPSGTPGIAARTFISGLLDNPTSWSAAVGTQPLAGLPCV